MKAKGKYRGPPRSMAIFPSNFSYTGRPDTPKPIKPFGLGRLMKVRAALNLNRT